MRGMNSERGLHMKKKLKLLISLLVMLCVLSACAFIPESRLDSLFENEQETVITSGNPSAMISAGNDTVMISRDEYEKLQKFSEMLTIFDFANEHYYQDIDQDKLIEYATRGLMLGLEDPYSYYYNPKEYTELWEDDEGNYTGIGVLISSNQETQICTISRVFKGSPAEEVGVQRGDILYRVGEDLYVNSSNLQDAVDIMRGEPGTDVEVTFLRNGEEITYTITRRNISVNQVESTMIDDRIGYIAFYQFAGDAEKEFETELKRLLSNGAKGIIIDLRDNPGGWVDQARYIADLFMDEGVLCYTQYRDGEKLAEYVTTDGKIETKLVIMINENTASSSEILTGALRDCAGAVTVGVKSYGKGIIQGVYPVGNKGAGYQMTIAQYFTPKGDAVHKTGIQPDYEVPLPEGDNGAYDFADIQNDIQLKKAVEVMNELLKYYCFRFSVVYIFHKSEI